MDLAFLAAATGAAYSDRQRIEIAALAVANVTALDILDSARQST